ncbi:MAG: hypothetical protein ACM3JP_02730, partial [Betaproteobacteria bacterium]
MPRYRAVLVSLTVVSLLAGCTGKPSPTTSATPHASATTRPEPDGPHAHIALPQSDTVIARGASAADLAISTSQALFQQTPAVVLVGETDEASMAAGARTATKLGVPLLLTPAEAVTDAGAALRTELTRLAPRTVITVGPQATAWQSNANSPTPTVSVTASGDAQGAALPDIVPDTPLDSLFVLAVQGRASEAAVATAHAAGTEVVMLASADPRSNSASIKALTGHGAARVLAIGSAFGSAALLRSRLQVAGTGVELPGGGQVIFPGRRMVALYGHPGAPVLGVLGEQNLTASVARAKQVAAAYSALVSEPVVPAFEIIATVAAASAGPDGNYSNETAAAALKPWVETAKANGIYVVLDLQPGRSDFLSQAKLYSSLLLYPNVGLALDPEWHMKSNQVPMEVIGSVDSSEINKTSQWLAQLVKDH